MEHNTTGDIDKCPFMSGDQKKSAGEGTSNRDWWPNELKLNILRQNASKSNPMGNDFDYAKAFNSVNFNELKKDVIECNDRFSRLVASRLWTLWSFYDSYGLAQCRNL